ncbi:NAD-dependent epimerase/dehydratase family protein [Bailinhaonella thermotolerans]|uniref:NAD(P)-dependent oxidoreductase n=1 Tax=Bailinhaonella thermotolerans TaxID=1070861 RepID=A0A3A4AXB2_9ACTN|nr:NAD(P)-dependent oxidoreductase [Bailinhaonella thermotolerans]RJL33533.1 NAD(P)-dependent oxidoreductase [Bailinhaonella thermotolerans]
MSGRYLVTGATGFVGRRLVERLLAEGAQVTALVRRTRGLPLPVRAVIGDLATGDGLEEAVRDADHVVHLAGVVRARNAAGYFRVNHYGTSLLVRALAQRPVPPRLVLCSSLAAAGPRLTGRPVSLYGLSKRAGEDVAREYAGRVPTIIVRPPIVYGPGDPALLPSLLPMIRLGLVAKAGLGERRYSLIHVDDLCEVLIAAAERGRTVRPGDPSHGVYEVDDGREYTWAEVCAALARALGRRPPVVVPVPIPLVRAAAWAAEAGGRTPWLNRDKVREMTARAWTCDPARDGHDLGLPPPVSLPAALAALFAADPADGVPGERV